MLGHLLVVFVVSVGSLGDVVLRVGSSMLGRLVGWCRHSARSVAVCFRWPFLSFFSVVSPLCACASQLLFSACAGQRLFRQH